MGPPTSKKWGWGLRGFRTCSSPPIQDSDRVRMVHVGSRSRDGAPAIQLGLDRSGPDRADSPWDDTPAAQAIEPGRMGGDLGSLFEVTATSRRDTPDRACGRPTAGDCVFMASPRRLTMMPSTSGGRPGPGHRLTVFVLQCRSLFRRLHPQALQLVGSPFHLRHG